MKELFNFWSCIAMSPWIVSGLNRRFTYKKQPEDQIGNRVKYHRCDKGKCYLERSGRKELHKGNGQTGTKKRQNSTAAKGGTRTKV